MIFDYIFIAPVASLLVAMIFKNILFWYKDKKVSVDYVLADGGMPSAHSATMAGLTMALFFSEGLDPVFYLSLFVTLIVFRDATGVRLESSKQAALLNKMLKKSEPHHKLLKELIGHTRRQVFAGAIIGVIVSSLLFIMMII